MIFVNVCVMFSLKHFIVIATDGPFTMLRRPWRKAGRGMDDGWLASVKSRFCEPLDCYRWWFWLHMLFLTIILLLLEKTSNQFMIWPSTNFWCSLLTPNITEVVNVNTSLGCFHGSIEGSSSTGCGRVSVGWPDISNQNLKEYRSGLRKTPCVFCH